MHIYGKRKLSSTFVAYFLIQFYTFLETTLVTLSLLRLFIAFFTDGDITGTPGSLVATFITFGKLDGNSRDVFLSIWWLYPYHYCYCRIVSVLNLSFALSIMGFLVMHISLVVANTTTIEVMPFVLYIYLCFAYISKGFELVSHIKFLLSQFSFFQAYEKKTNPKWRYDLGRKENFEQVACLMFI